VAFAAISSLSEKNVPLKKPPIKAKKLLEYQRDFRRNKETRKGKVNLQQFAD